MPDRARVAIDARKLRDFGIGTYIRNILTELSRAETAHDFVVLARPQDVGLAESLAPRFRVVAESAVPYSVAEQWRIPLRLLRERVQLVHEPHYVLPPLTRCRSVVTIHDCIHLMFPQYLPNRLGYVYARSSMFTATRQAARVLVSEASKRDILRFFDIPPDKVEVVYNRHRRTLPDASRRSDDRPRAPALPARPPVRAVSGQHQAAQEPRAADRGVRPVRRMAPTG